MEKIKVISSTYMAACGLQPGRKGSGDLMGLGGGATSTSLAEEEADMVEAGYNARTLAR